ncbi:MAG: acetate kinase [Ferrimonas sp.]
MSNLVLVINCGSSSLKFAVIDGSPAPEHDNDVHLLTGLAECLTLDDARIKWEINGHKETRTLGAGASHQDALDCIVEHILPTELAEQLVAIGHRVVHGGELYAQSIVIDDAVLAGIEQCASLAPLHNPPALVGIRAAQQAFKLPHVAVFDTAFHQTMPDHAFTYALPQQLYRKHQIRRYGMHGTSHRYVSQKAAELLGLASTECNVISCHLGNGASITAVQGGRSLDTSMGMTPLEGLVMGTRSGDLDPALIFHLVDTLGYDLAQVKTMLNQQSGLLGISELSSDCRAILEGADAHHPGCVLALEVMCYRLAKYINSYFVPLKRVDAIVFTGGIGENAAPIRAKVLEYLDFLGYQLDPEANLAARFGEAGCITAQGSPIAMVIPTDEEFVIASDAISLVQAH